MEEEQPVQLKKRERRWVSGRTLNNFQTSSLLVSTLAPTFTATSLVMATSDPTQEKDAAPYALFMRPSHTCEQRPLGSGHVKYDLLEKGNCSYEEEERNPLHCNGKSSYRK
jgi:hypothetical protein